MAKTSKQPGDAEEPIRWTTAMSVGVPELDEDHKGLIEVINLLKQHSGADAGSDVIRQCLVSLMRYAQVHFGREERVMTICTFPGLAHHQEEHRVFVDRMKEIDRRFADDPDGLSAFVAEELVDYLSNWLRHHILIEDMAYRSFAEHRMAEAREAARSFRTSQVWFSDS